MKNTSIYGSKFDIFDDFECDPEQHAEDCSTGEDDARSDVFL